LTVTPATGTAPVQVTADGTGSTDPQGQTLSYAFDWGDGSSTPAQPGGTANHTYPAAGSYPVTLTVTNTAGRTDTTTKTVTVAAPAPAFGGQLGSTSSTATPKTATITTTSAVQTGDMIVVAAQANFGTNKPVTAADGAGDVYAVATSQTDANGAKLSVLYARAVKTLPIGFQITITFASGTPYQVSASRLTGVSTLDRSAIATGKTATFSSSATKATATAREVLVGFVSVTLGSSTPVWTSDWTPGATQAAAPNYLAQSSRAVSAVGTFAATGTVNGTWTSTVLTFRP
jgi:PKD repeat protein